MHDEELRVITDRIGASTWADCLAGTESLNLRQMALLLSQTLLSSIRASPTAPTVAQLVDILCDRSVRSHL